MLHENKGCWIILEYHTDVWVQNIHKCTILFFRTFTSHSITSRLKTKSMYLEPTLRTVYWHPCWPQMTSLHWWGSPWGWQVQIWAMFLARCPPEPPVLLPCLRTRSTGTDNLECWPTGPFLTPVTMTVCWRLWLSSTVLWYLSLAGELGCRAKIWGKYCRM